MCDVDDDADDNNNDDDNEFSCTGAYLNLFNRYEYSVCPWDNMVFVNFHFLAGALQLKMFFVTMLKMT